MPGLPQARVRIHVLGPPRKDEVALPQGSRTGESYDHALAAASHAGRPVPRGLQGRGFVEEGVSRRRATIRSIS